MDRKIKKSIILFSLISISCGWLGALLNTILTKQPEGYSLGMLLWLVLPLLTAVLIRVFMKDNSNSLGFKPNFKGNLKWYLVSFLIFPSITLFVVTIGYISNWTDFSKFHFTEFAAAFLGMFVANFIKNIFEEFSWRGFLTERLIMLKCSDEKIYSIVAIVWSLWHVPYYLFFLSADSIGESRITALFGIIVTIVCWIIMFTELYRLTRSSWTCVILHTVINSIPIIYNYVSIKGGKDIFINNETGIISLAICIFIGIIMRSYMIKKSADKTRLNECNF